MEKLLMLGTTPTSVELINMAKARGVYTITTDYLEPEKSSAKLISDEYWMISTSDLDALEQKCREEGVTAVISGISEYNIQCMARLCQRLGLPCWCTPTTWDAIQKKDQFKKLCRENGVPIAKDYFLSNPPTEQELNEIQFPVVVKPVDLNYNRGMSYCYSKEDVVKACEYARSVSSSENLIVERMFTGLQYAAYYALADGEISQFALGAGGFFQPGYPRNCYCVLTTANNQQDIYLKEMAEPIEKLIKAAGCKDGMCWVQLFFEDNHFYAIEMGYRCTGGMLEVPLKSAIDFDAYEWLLEVQLGVKHTAADLPKSLKKAPERTASTYILWSKSSGVVQRIEGVEEIAKIPGMYIRQLAQVGMPFTQYSYMVVFAFDSDKRENLFEMMQKINSTVRIYDENGNNPLIYFDDFDSIRSIMD